MWGKYDFMYEMSIEKTSNKDQKQQFYLDEFEKYKAAYGDVFDETDPYNKIFYEWEKGTEMEEAVSHNVKNLEALILHFKENKKEILDTLKTGNLEFITNHPTWMNLPILAMVLHVSLGIPYEKIFIILGPALTLHSKFRKAFRQIGNALKTLPSTASRSYMRKGGVDILRAFKDEVKKRITGETGKIILLAVSGTTDKFKDNKILMKTPVNGVIKSIKMRTKKVLYVGMNDLEIFPNKEPHQGNVYFKASKIMDVPNSVEEIKKHLQPLIIDKLGNRIGEFYEEAS
jgi:arsenate reductase-like glutaredoxin family protein